VREVATSCAAVGRSAGSHRQAHARCGARGSRHLVGDGLFANNYGTRVASHLARRFSNLYGCQWWNPTMICWGLGGFGLGLTGILETNTKEDMGAHAAFILLWGANLASQPNTARHLVAAGRRGAHVITIDVRRTEAAAHSDENLVIRPGTDAALALGMMHVIVRDRIYNAGFVARNTVGFDALETHVERHSPQWAADVTGIAAERIVALARHYATAKPAMIVQGPLDAILDHPATGHATVAALRAEGGIVAHPVCASRRRPAKSSCTRAREEPGTAAATGARRSDGGAATAQVPPRTHADAVPRLL